MQLAEAQTNILCIQMQQESALSMPTQIEQDDNSSLLATNNSDNVSQYLNFAASSNVIQEPALKRESLWT